MFFKPYRYSVLVKSRSDTLETLYFYEYICALDALSRLWDCKCSDGSNVYFATGPYPLTRDAYFETIKRRKRNE